MGFVNPDSPVLLQVTLKLHLQIMIDMIRVG